MDLYCLEDFKVEFEKLNSKKSYKTIEKDLINYFFDKSSQELSSGTRLNNSDVIPYIKKRLRGSGGFRCYYLLIIKGDALYLMFVHPKTGSRGSENITDESKAYLYKKVLECIKSEDLYKLTVNESKTKINFQNVISDHS
jgi:hypothetical protein